MQPKTEVLRVKSKKIETARKCKTAHRFSIGTQEKITHSKFMTCKKYPKS